MREAIKQIILEFHDSAIPVPSERDIKLPNLPEGVRKAFVYIGMRRSGKTWALYQRMHELMQQGLSKQYILYINFEDDRLNNLALNDLQLILDIYWELYPDLIDSKQLHFFFDEIAEVEGWESFIRRLLDKEQMQIYLSGSSAKMLSKEIATNLRGRTVSREIFPMSFEEYLHHQNFDVATKSRLTAKQKAVLNHHVNQYLNFGGFPETLGTDVALHREILQGYIDTVIYRDIIERHNIKNHIALKQLLLSCLQSATGLLSINKLFNQFKSRGMRVSKDALYQYIDYFEDAYCLFSVSVYSLSLNKAQLKPKKIYPVDTGLITAYSTNFEYSYPGLLEAEVFLQLRRQYKEIYYYQTAQGTEVDFLTVNPNGEKKLYQVSYVMKDEKTRRRELAAVTQAMSELGLSQGVIITMSESSEIKTPEGVVCVISLLEFLFYRYNDD